MVSCYKMMCYVLATVHIVLFGHKLIKNIKILIEIKEGIDFELEKNKYYFVIHILAISIIILNICMAVVLLIGLQERRPKYVGAFRFWALLILVVYGIDFFEYFGYGKLVYEILFIVFIVAEVWTVGIYYDMLLEETRNKRVITTTKTITPPSCKTFCYVFASVHIFKFTLWLISCTLDESKMKDMVESAFLRKHAPDFVDKILVPITEFEANIYVLQIYVAIAFIIGIKKRRPQIVRSYQIFILVWLILHGSLALTVYGESRLFLFQLTFIVIYVAEAWTAGRYCDILLKKMHQDGKNNARNDITSATQESDSQLEDNTYKHNKITTTPNNTPLSNKMCYFIAILHMVLSSGLLAWILIKIITPTKFAPKVDSNWVMGVAAVICSLHIQMALVFFIGIKMRHPACVRAFRFWALLWLVIGCLKIFTDIGHSPNVVIYLIPAIVFFAAEARIAGYYHHILSEEIRKKRVATVLSGDIVSNKALPVVVEL